MKKITTILMLLVLTCMGAWAEDGTIVVTSGNAIWTSNDGAYTNTKVWTSSAAGKPTVTITGASQKNANAWNMSNGVLMANSANDGTLTLTIAIAGDFRITGFSLTGQNAWGGTQEIIFSSNGESAQGTSNVQFSVSGLNTSSTTMTVVSATGGERAKITNFEIYYTELSDYTENVNANILPWIESIDDNGYFTLDPTNTAVQALQTAYDNHTSDTWTEGEYNTLLDLLDAAKNANAYIMPETGYYRLKANTVSGRPEGYIGYSQTTLPNYSNRGVGLRNIAIADAATDASTILKLTKVAEGQYTISTEGLYVMDQEMQGQLFPVTDVAANAAVFVPTIHETVPGKAFFGTATNSKKWGFHNSDWNAIVGWTNTEPSYWILEDANVIGEGAFALEIALTTIGDKSYATTCLPFPVKLSEEAAYKVTISGKKAVEEPIGDVIPANIPVLLISDASTTLTATIQETTATVDCGDLKGVRVKTAKADLQGETPVVLNQSNGKVGFYKLADGSSLSANRAYLSYEEGTTPTSAKAFFEEGFELGGNEATAIENIENGAFENGAVYNLQGQRVVKAQKGVFIQNGKKVVLK